VRAVDGDIWLGGRNLDLLLLDWVAEEIKSRWGRDCLANPRSKQKLLEKCEQIKITLSLAEKDVYVWESLLYTFYSNNFSDFSLCMGDIFVDLDGMLEVTRATFEKIAKPTLIKAMEIVKRVLVEGKLSLDEIDEVLQIFL
jgi:molecular chaperone DnaK